MSMRDEHAGKLAVLLATAEERMFLTACRSRRSWSDAKND